MSFIEEMKSKAKSDIKTIVLPEATDLRVLKATEKIGKEGFAKVILIGDEEKVLKTDKDKRRALHTKKEDIRNETQL